MGPEENSVENFLQFLDNYELKLQSWHAKLLIYLENTDEVEVSC